MKTKVSVAIVVTVRNEEKTIEQLLDGIVAQTLPPSELVIVDAESIDSTLQLIKLWHEKHNAFPLTVLVKNGNRSIGRNLGISHAKQELIAITDAGCVPDKHWLAELVTAQAKTHADVVAGYYDARPTTLLEEAIVPYMLVMSDKVDEQSFLPATRSMLLKKSVWEKIGGFDERLTVSEDYEFAQRLREKKYKMSFTKKAIVHWLPFSSISHFSKTVFSMARFDVRAGIIRPKAMAVCGRYALAIIISLLLFATHQSVILFWLIGLIGYMSWSVLKNKRYVKRGWYWLPILQIIADMAVITGTTKGWLEPRNT